MLLDWRDPSHWNGGKVEPCRWCGLGCWTLDSGGRPSHKHCVENLLPDDDEPTPPLPPLDLAGIIAALGGKCPVCSRLVCACNEIRTCALCPDGVPDIGRGICPDCDAKTRPPP
jgi:hypothetical protein